jgi:hypothetical protein
MGLVLYLVDLVDHDDHWRVDRHELTHGPVAIVKAAGLDHEQDDIHLGERLPDATVHHPVQCVAMAGLKSGCIDKDVLGIRLGEDAHDAVPGRLRALRDNADFLAYQLVQ